MRVYSQDFNDGDKMPEKHVFNGMGYQGENISPHLAWEAAPEGTKSFVVTCYDPDAPTGSGWWHWLVANIPASTTSLPQGETHRYIFTVHALDVEKIEVDEGASGAMVGFNVHFHALASASLTVNYQ